MLQELDPSIRASMLVLYMHPSVSLLWLCCLHHEVFNAWSHGVGANAMGEASLWKTVLAEANVEHDVVQEWA